MKKCRRTIRTALAGVWLIGMLAACHFIPKGIRTPFENPNDLPRDAEGWTIFTPSADSRLIYVSGSTGDDNSADYYLLSDPAVGGHPFHPAAVIPFRTYAAACALAREGYPDWILFHRGETYDNVRIDLLSGRNEREYALTTCYGSGSLPLLHPDGESRLINGLSSNIRYCAVTDLDGYAAAHDPAAYPPGTMPPRCGAGLDVLTGNGVIHHILFEGVRLRCFEGNVIQSYEQGVVRDITLRRCTVLDNFQGDRADGHCQGLFVGGVTGLFIEECVFDHNGWYSQDDGNDTVELPGEATMFNHNTYIADCGDVTLRNNVFLRSSSIQNKFTANLGIPDSSPNIALQGNLYVDGEIGISLGGNVDTAYKFQGMTVTGNVFTEIGRSRPTNRTLGWGLDIADWDGGIVRDNYFIHNTTAAVDNTYAINISGGTRDVLITDNVIYGQNETGSNPWGNGIMVDHTFTKENISVRRNIIQEPGFPMVIASFASAEDAYNVRFLGNRYFLPGAAAEDPFRIGGDWLSFAQWSSRLHDNSEFAAAAFPDPGRDIAGYQALQGGPATIDAFILSCRTQNRDSWNDAYTAQTVTAWLKAGFAH